MSDGHIWNKAIKKAASICAELKWTSGSLKITSKRQMAELCETEILKELGNMKAPPAAMKVATPHRPDIGSGLTPRPARVPVREGSHRAGGASFNAGTDKERLTT